MTLELNSYAKRYILRYLKADKETQKASKKHWIDAYRAAEKSHDDLEIYIHMLAALTIADNIQSHIKEVKKA